jgi:hypothetical protein
MRMGMRERLPKTLGIANLIKLRNNWISNSANKKHNTSYEQQIKYLPREFLKFF